MKRILNSTVLILSTLGTVVLLAFQNCGQPFQVGSPEKILGLSSLATVKYEIFIASDKDVVSSHRSQMISLNIDPLHASEVSAFYCSLDNAPMKLCAANFPLIDLSERVHKLSVQGKTSSGAIIATGTYDFVVDVTAPTLLFSQAPGATVGQNSVTLVFSATDALSKVDVIECSLDNSPFKVVTSPYQIEDLSEALHSLKCRVTDIAKNVSQVSERTWTNSLSAPAIQLAASLPTFTAGSNQVAFTASSPTNLSVTTTCALDANSAAPCSSGQTYANLSAGIHVVKVTAKDSFNRESSATYSWTVDLTPPTVVITSNYGRYTNLTSIPVNFRVEDGMGSGPGSCECGAGQDPGAVQYAACVNPHLVSGASEGLKGAFIRCRDGVGNLSAPVKFDVTVDRTAPSLIYSTTAVALSSNKSANFTFTVAETVSNPARVQTRLDNAAVFNDSGLTLALSNLTDGSHTLQMRAVDEAGNISPVQSFSWVIDTAPPEPPTEIQLNYLSGFEEVKWNASVDAGGITHYELKVGSAPGADDLVPITRNTSVTYSVPYQIYSKRDQNGSYYNLFDGRVVYVSVRATDRLGNVSAWASSGPTNHNLRDSNFPYRISCSAGGSCRASVRLKTDDATLSIGKVVGEDYLHITTSSSKLQVLSATHGYTLSRLIEKTPGTLTSRCKIQGNSFSCDVVNGEQLPGLGGFVAGSPNKVEVEILYNGEVFFKTDTLVDYSPTIFPTGYSSETFTGTAAQFFRDARASDIFMPLLNVWAEGPIKLSLPYICWKATKGTEARVIVRDRATLFADGAVNSFQDCNMKIYADSSATLFFGSGVISELVVMPGAQVFYQRAFGATNIAKLTKLESPIPAIATCPHSATGGCPAGIPAFR